MGGEDVTEQQSKLSREYSGEVQKTFREEKIKLGANSQEDYYEKTIMNKDLFEQRHKAALDRLASDPPAVEQSKQEMA